MTALRRSRTLLAATVAVGVLAPAGIAAAQETVPPPAPALLPGVIAPGVTVDGVDVGGLARADAKAKVLAERVAPARESFAASFRGTPFKVNPVALGYAADVDYALKAALLFGRSRAVPATGADVPLRERVSTAKVKALVAAKAAKLDVAPQDAAIRFSGATAVVIKARAGVSITQGAAAKRIQDAILGRRPKVVTLPQQRVRPAVTQAPPAILINRNTFTLTLYKGGSRRNYGVAVGQPSYPTPSGTFSIVSMQVNPTWTPPNSAWAAGLGPVAPGAGNPLGTRWMGLNIPGYGIHGTPTPSSIGTRASHGCIRMRIPDAESLFSQISVGTKVVIV